MTHRLPFPPSLPLPRLPPHLLPPLLLLLLLSLLSPFPQSASAACPAQLYGTDLTTLLDIRTALNGKTGYLSDWRPNNTVEACCWAGVICGRPRIQYRVRELRLAGGIFDGGELPAAVGRLKYLKVLDLSGNGFHGAVPSSWQKLTSLTSLDLSGNKVNGSLTFLGSFLGMTELKLSMNRLEGPLPDKIGDLVSLSVLDLSGNGFSGPIPYSWASLSSSLTVLNLGGNLELNGSIETVTNLTELSTIDLSNNQFSGSFNALFFPIFPKLKNLWLQGNQFSGTFPPWLNAFNFPNLEVLDLGYNPNLSPSALPTSAASWPPNLTSVKLLYMKLFGPIPKVLGFLPLSELDLTANFLNGSIPSEFGNFNYSGPEGSGIALVLRQNQISGVLPPNFKNGSFYTLDLRDNLISGGIEFFINGLCSGPNADFLTYLDFSSNRFSGSIPSKFSKCSNLYNVQLGQNFLNGFIPKELSSLSSLASLGLELNNLSGIIPPELVNLQNFREFTVYNNGLSGAIPQFTQLVAFYAFNNKLSGPLPSSFSNCPLEDLRLQNNQLSGPILALSTATGLFYLDLSKNFFNATLSLISNWPNMLYLDLSQNNFTGAIPTTFLTNMKNLVELNLSKNSFVNPIPTSLFGCLSLQTLDLSENQISGTLSSTIANLRYLTDLNLSGNQLSGRLPVLSSLFNLQKVSLANNFFTGSLFVSVVSEKFTADVSSNFLSGPISVLQNGQLYCPVVSSNCLTGDSWGRCPFKPQKTTEICTDFCNAGNPDGACGGHGSCDVTLKTCTCDEGYKINVGGKSCIPTQIRKGC